MLAATRSLQTATDSSPPGRTAMRAGAMAPRRVLVLAALLLLLAGAALYGGVVGEPPSVAPAVRSGSSSHDALASLPVAAQGTVSATLGAEDPAYRVRPSGGGLPLGGGLQAKNAAQRLNVRFGPSGVHIASGTVHLGLSLRAAGYGASLQGVAAGSPRVEANRVTYPHREL